jgi:MFS family permease
VASAAPSSTRHPSSAPAHDDGPLASLKATPAWRTLWLVGHVWHVAYWIDLAVLSWLMFQLTGSALYVSLVGAARMAPFGVLGFLAGTWADRMPKRTLLIVAQVLNLGGTLAFLLVLLAGAEQVWHIDAASLVGSGLVGRLGAGALLSLGGPPAAYLVLTVMYAGALAVLLRIPSRPPAPRAAGGPSVLRELREGLAYAWRVPELRGILLITCTVNLFVFPYFAVLPAILLERFALGEGLYGVIGSVDSLGSIVATGALLAFGVRRGFGRVFLGASLAVSLGVVLLGIAPTWPVAVPALLLAGLGGGGFAPMQNTITATVAEERMRGRAMGAIALSIGVLPLGMLYMGLLSDAVGTAAALTGSALVGGALVLAITLAQPRLRRA